MVAFAGRKYAARSLPVQVADFTHTITSFTLVKFVESIICHFTGHSLFTLSSSFFSVSLVFDSRYGSPQVLEFQKGTLQNLYWKKFGCDSCSGDSAVCLNNQDCAVPNSKCGHAGACNIGIQLTFSGTDKNDVVLNSWYEVKNLRRYSLYGLYSDLRDRITSPYENMF